MTLSGAPACVFPRHDAFGLTLAFSWSCPFRGLMLASFLDMTLSGAHACVLPGHGPFEGRRVRPLKRDPFQGCRLQSSKMTLLAVVCRRSIVTLWAAVPGHSNGTLFGAVAHLALFVSAVTAGNIGCLFCP